VSSPRTPARQYCAFRVDDLLLGIELGRVREVLRRGDPTPVPGASNDVLGLMNLRGEIVTVLDIRSRLGLPPATRSERSVYVVLDSGDESVSLVADEVHEVIAVDEAAFEEPPNALPARLRRHLTGIYKLPGRLLLALDVDAAVELAGAAAATTGARGDIPP